MFQTNAGRGTQMYYINHGRTHGGFTLVELMVTITVLTILLSLGVPAFAELLASWQRDRATKAITAHLQLARIEALKSTRRVVICNSMDNIYCAPKTYQEWKDGWLLFHDLNKNNIRDDDEPLIAATQPMTGILSLKASNNINHFVFMPSGTMTSGMSTLKVAPRLGRTQNVTVSRIGRVRLSLATTEP